MIRYLLLFYYLYSILGIVCFKVMFSDTDFHFHQVSNTLLTPQIF